MNGNILFLVCTPCEQAASRPGNPDSDGDFGVKLAVRTQRGYYDPHVPPKEFAKWLAKHSKCGGRTNPDHFQLAMLATANHDQKDLEAAVKLAVVN